MFAHVAFHSIGPTNQGFLGFQKKMASYFYENRLIPNLNGSMSHFIGYTGRSLHVKLNTTSGQSLLPLYYMPQII